MEKLIEEITQRALWIAHDPMTARFRTKELIARIGKAYADGELELPGEVGRYRLLPPGSRTYSEWALDMHIEAGANDFIALRPLSGTGKEEEK